MLINTTFFLMEESHHKYESTYVNINAYNTYQDAMSLFHDFYSSLILMGETVQIW